MSGLALAKWLEDISATLGVHSQYVLWGNVRDLHISMTERGIRTVETVDAVAEVLRAAGVSVVLVHDPVSGLDVLGGEDAARATAAEVTGLALQHGPVPVTLPRLAEVAAEVATCTISRIALVVPYASRLCVDAANLTPEEHAFFVAIERLSRSATPRSVDGGPAGFNPVIWVLSREQDFPHWVTSGNELIRTVVVPEPDLGDRQRMAEFTLGVLAYDTAGAERGDVAREVAGSTESMSLRAVRDCVRLAHTLGLPADDLDDGVRCYRVGVADNPWRKGYLRQRIEEGEGTVGARVLGQEQAITSTFDILKRSVMGLSGAHTSGQGGRPRGILFFAGPTGVGKTELAKAITQLVFGDDAAYLRFDMSEYSAEQAEARLVGAPPGFVGYDAGGQLTNAVRRRPFSLVLFDEVEKAHPRILDKFLQVLEDGRLTDGRGGTVHFSETLIVFTSNLGVYRVDESGVRRPVVDEDTPHEEMAKRLRASIAEHFTLGIGRPELLNRIGENIVVFSFITEDVARRIFDLQLGNVLRRIHAEHGLRLDVPPEVAERIRTHCVQDRSLGGRGIGNQVEAVLVNPLARALFASPTLGDAVTLEQWTYVDGVATVQVS